MYAVAPHLVPSVRFIGIEKVSLPSTGGSLDILFSIKEDNRIHYLNPGTSWTEYRL